MAASRGLWTGESGADKWKVSRQREDSYCGGKFSRPATVSALGCAGVSETAVYYTTQTLR